MQDRGCQVGFVGGRPQRDGAGRRGLILPVVLLILALLALLAASFAFQVNADSAATRALVERMQTRLAAEAGFQYVALVLRDHLEDVNAWYDNEEKFRGVVVWSATGGLSTFGAVEKSDTQRSQAKDKNSVAPAYRFSVVADDPNDDQVKVRYGITDEASKLNINTATAAQLTRLIAQVVPPEVQVEPLVDALLDWRDPDDTVSSNGEGGGAESDYYRSLKVPYRCKNAPFDTVEELLMVRGFTGQILYGEDADRNGLLSPNEDDGNVTFPPDNADGALNRGLYPYITVHSREFNRANDRKPRVVLVGGGSNTRLELEPFFSAEEADYLVARAAATGESRPTSLTAFLETASTNGLVSPFMLEDFPRIVDRCTLDPSPELRGLININTAPPAVLRCLEGLTAEDVNNIVQKRATLSAETKQTPAWLLTQGVLDQEKYDAVAEGITARGLQFTAEVVGYADHLGVRARFQIIFGMRGPVPQILYYRDLTNLGVPYPLTREEEETGGYAHGLGGKTTG
jgi:type II secretory pathway component PulK